MIERFSRRAVLGAGTALLLPSLARRRAAAEQTPLPTTPQCGNYVTPAQTEGPYFTPSSPERTNLLEDGTPGERIALLGYVLDQSCRPVAGALLDLWHCD